MPNSLFLSHASTDQPLADAFLEMVQQAIGLAPDDIFYSSGKGTGVPAGAEFSSHIRDRLRAAPVVVALISPAFRASEFCLAELGAVWAGARSKDFFPLAVPPTQRSELSATLVGIQAEALDDRSALAGLLQRVSKRLDRRYSAAAADGAVSRFVHRMPTLLSRIAEQHQAQKEPERPILARVDEVDDYQQSVRDRLAAARELVLVSGADCAFVCQSQSASIEAATRRGVAVRVLCISPRLSDEALSAVVEIDPRFSSPEHFREEVASVAQTLRRIVEAGHAGSLELRYMPFVQAINYFVVDPGSSGASFKVESYTPTRDLANSHRDVKLREAGRPHWILPSSLVGWRRDFLEIWEHYWTRAVPAFEA
jgi:hypothetical protein